MDKTYTRVQLAHQRSLIVGEVSLDGRAEAPLHASWIPILTDPVRLSVLQRLCRLGTATTAELTELCHCSDPTIRRHLAALEALGLVLEEPGRLDGLTPGRPARRFVLEPEAAARLCALFELLSEPLVPTPEPA